MRQCPPTPRSARQHCSRPIPAIAGLAGRRPASNPISPVVSPCRRYCCGVPSDGYSDAELAEMLVDLESDLIAEVMRNLGFVQHFGLGIPLAREALAANGNPEPEFDVQHTWVRATVRPSRSPR